MAFVRDCIQGILQFSYGEDGLAGEYVEKQGIFFFFYKFFFFHRLSQQNNANERRLPRKRLPFFKKEEYKDILDDNVYESLPEEGQEGFLQRPPRKGIFRDKKGQKFVKINFYET